MRYNGRLNEWNDDRGFGFALIPGRADRVFVHIKAFDREQTRPVATDMLTFELHDGPKGPAAKRVRHAGTAAPDTSVRAEARRNFSLDWLLAAVLVPIQGLGTAQLPLPAWKWGVLPVAAIVAFCAYKLDKGYARQGERRTREATLLMLSIPGWVGALAAQQRYRHKSSKRGFYAVFRVIGLIQAGVIAWFLWKGI